MVPHFSPPDLRSAVVRMVNDQDHSVRMYMARAVSSLYREGKGVWSLLPRPEQEEAFQQVSEMLKKAHMVQVGVVVGGARLLPSITVTGFVITSPSLPPSSLLPPLLSPSPPPLPLPSSSPPSLQTSQDDISAEDESVNRVSSMISTLLCEAGTSPACERKVVSILATAVGQGHIDLDLVCKVESIVVGDDGLDQPRTQAPIQLFILQEMKSWMRACVRG